MLDPTLSKKKEEITLARLCLSACYIPKYTKSILGTGLYYLLAHLLTMRLEICYSACVMTLGSFVLHEMTTRRKN